MRVLYIHQYFVPPGAAGGTRSLEIARRLVARGHEVVMLTSDAFFGPLDTTSAVSAAGECGISLEVVKRPYSNRMSRRQRVAAFAYFAFEASRRAVRLSAPDLVFATSTPLTVAIPARVASRFFGVPYVFEVRDLWPELPVAVGAIRNPIAIFLARALERWAYKGAAQIIALSPGMREGVLRSYVYPDRVSVIPNGCDLDLFGKPGPRPQVIQKLVSDGFEFVVSYCGTLGPINAVERYLPDLCAEVAALDPRIAFLVVGDGWGREALLRRATELGVLRKNLFWHPPVSKTDVAGIVQHSSAGMSLFAPIEEMWHNSANKFFDTLAAGRPVFLNYGGWQSSLVRSYGAGLILPPAPTQQAAQMVAGALSDVNWMRKAADGAATLAREEFDRDRLVEGLICRLEEAAQCRVGR